MANWDKITSRGNVDDRRGQMKSGVAGFGLTGILLIMGVTYLMGGNPLNVLTQIDPASLGQPNQTVDVSQFEGVDSYETFAGKVLGSTNDFWKSALANTTTVYTEPTLVLFRGYTTSGCSGANSASGPHYCPLDNTIYLDETFFAELSANLGAKGGDVAEAYVIAHEVGHHVQNITGTLNETADSVQIELQADCYAGAWAGSLKDTGVFELNEITEAMDAAAAVGDDNIQEKTQGEVHPESWTHGSSDARVQAFSTGYETGDYLACQYIQ
jgi:predicted metalloprotease